MPVTRPRKSNRIQIGTPFRPTRPMLARSEQLRREMLGDWILFVVAQLKEAGMAKRPLANSNFVSLRKQEGRGPREATVSYHGPRPSVRSESLLSVGLY